MRRMIREAYCVKGEIDRRIVMGKVVRPMSFLAMFLLLLLHTTGGSAADLALDTPRTMRFPTVEFNPPDAERVVLENGMVVYLLEDHELPLVTINATLKTGSWLDPAGEGRTRRDDRRGDAHRWFGRDVARRGR